MPTIYCQSCGAGTKYLYGKPESCPSCFESFVKIPVVAKQEKYDHRQLDDDLKDDLEPEPQIIYKRSRKNKNVIGKVRINVDKVFPEKFGSIVGSSPEEEPFERKKMNAQEFKAAIFKQASSEIE